MWTQVYCFLISPKKKFRGQVLIETEFVLNWFFFFNLYRFRFWHFGEWKDIIVDDRLPTFKGRLVYLHSTNPTEFWVALLEKAYAKFYGSYESLHQGFTTRALQDLTGGIVQSFGLNNQEKYLTFQVLNSAVPRSTLIIASINPVSKVHAFWPLLFVEFLSTCLKTGPRPF